MIKLETIKIKTSRSYLNPLGKEKFKGFVINRSESTITVLKPTDKTMAYFHLINIKDKTITPILGVVSRLELSPEFDFTDIK